MKTMKMLFVGLFIFLISFQATFAAELFTRYLQKGSSGADVMVLQRVLNSNPDTRVAEVGPGSLGSETELFGELTKQAVIKYQKNNNLGNKLGFFTLYSGALDDQTRAKLNEQFSATTSTSTISQDQFNEKYKTYNSSTLAPRIDSVNPSSVSQGDTITISGRNFSTSSENTIITTYNRVNAVSKDGTSLEIRINSTLQDLFNKEAGGLEDDERDIVLGKMGTLPLFVMVTNRDGISNPYQLSFKLK
jgi:peptidoglycan hydrolase-like protein with peptidoglycan-binding domain